MFDYLEIEISYIKTNHLKLYYKLILERGKI